MDNIRFLENKFFYEIIKHIKLALPNVDCATFNLSTEEEDTKHSFDMVCNVNFNISVRIRKNKYIKYPDMTIRSKTKNGGKTEIDKIIEGKSQIYFYAFMNTDENKLKKIRIFNVDAIRKLTNSKKYSERKNNDGSEFYTYLFSDIFKENGAIYKYN
ncbi:hypothetical protein N9515_10125 [Vicingaceae bacterium]|nr:hypothetical protein [Vicingaceae bacterium]